MARLRIVGAACLLSLLVGGASFAAPPFGKKPVYADGQEIEITGLVTDRFGKPIPGLTVMLEASRREFSWKKMRRQIVNPAVVSRETNSAGEYRLPWKWQAYYNRFEVRAVLVVPGPNGKRLIHELTHLDLSGRITNGTPVVAPLTLGDTEFLDKYRSFLASIDSAGERQVFDHNGKPDKVQTFNYPDRTEEAWWYFEIGKVFRFANGEFTSEDDFEPVINDAGKSPSANS